MLLFSICFIKPELFWHADTAWFTLFSPNAAPPKTPMHNKATAAVETGLQANDPGSVMTLKDFGFFSQ